MFATRTGAARLSLVVVLGLIAVKVVVAVITDSISILAQAVDSFLDLFAVIITFLAVVIATRPADTGHPFGHGKVENVAAVVQAVLIFSAGGLIIFSAVNRIITGAKVEMAEAGIGVMLVSIIASIFLSRYLRKVALATDSIALEANAHNIAADVYSAGAVLVGLVAVRFTGFDMLDPILALAVSLLIFKAGYDVLRRSFGGLIDVKLPDGEEKVITESILRCSSTVIDFHKLRTRKVGNQRHVDLHLVVPKDASVEEAHQICDQLEHDIASRLSHSNVTIHVEPCSEECDQCLVICHLREERD
ncbi:cation diffusion facilitator family transporter [Chloroflexota bacterium]